MPWEKIARWLHERNLVQFNQQASLNAQNLGKMKKNIIEVQKTVFMFLTFYCNQNHMFYSLYLKMDIFWTEHSDNWNISTYLAARISQGISPLRQSGEHLRIWLRIFVWTCQLITPARSRQKLPDFPSDKFFLLLLKILERENNFLTVFWALDIYRPEVVVDGQNIIYTQTKHSHHLGNCFKQNCFCLVSIPNVLELE